MNNSRGFTLIELMVVVVLIAVLSSITMLSVASQNSRSDRAMVERLVIHLQQAWLWSELSHQSTRVEFLDSSYSIQSWSKGTWAVSEIATWAKNHTLDEEMLPQFISGGETEPEIIFLAGGEYRPFELEITMEEQAYRILGDGFNQPQLQSN